MDRLGDSYGTAPSTSNGQQEVPLTDELEMLQKYMDIEQARFGARLSVSMSIEPDTLAVPVPTFLLAADRRERRASRRRATPRRVSSALTPHARGTGSCCAFATVARASPTFP